MSNAQRIFSPIYTHLDNDNPSRALKECELVLKKNSKKGNALDKNGEVWQTTTVLKAIAFQRLNRVEEALQAAQTVCDAQPNDETLLQEFGLIFNCTLTPAGEVTNKLSTSISLKMAERNEAKSAKQSFALKYLEILIFGAKLRFALLAPLRSVIFRG